MVIMLAVVLFFFKQNTAYELRISDWSSDVCSSDLRSRKMAARRRFNTESGMATRWRRRRMCVLVCERPFPASLRDVSANGAFLETNARPDIGGRVELQIGSASCRERVCQDV